MNIRIYLCQKNDTNICIGKYLNIFEYPNICHTLCHTVRHMDQEDMCATKVIISKTSQELRMLSSVTINCQITKKSEFFSKI